MKEEGFVEIIIIERTIKFKWKRRAIALILFYKMKCNDKTWDESGLFFIQ